MKLWAGAVVFLIAALDAGAANATSTAEAVVENFQAVLIDVMRQGKELGFSGRYAKLESAIQESHDLSKIARIVVGKEWKNLTEEQQRQLTDSFRRLSVSAYAHNFKDFSGEAFVFVSAEDTALGGKIIHTLLQIPQDRDVKFDYMMKQQGDSWKIINIVANGISDLALKRSEYTSILQREGFAALIEKIDEKTKAYENNNGT